jgi:hypothetical protein
MGRTACTEPQCLYSRAILLLPLWAVRPVQSLSACTRVHSTFYLSGRLLGQGFPQSQDLYRCFQIRWTPKHAEVITKYKPSYALCTLLRNADHLNVGHLAVNTAINMQDLMACWASGAVLYIVQHRTCFLHCFPGLVIIMTSCWEAGRTARKDSLFTFAAPHLAEASPIARHKEQYKHGRNTYRHRTINISKFLWYQWRRKIWAHACLY